MLYLVKHLKKKWTLFTYSQKQFGGMPLREVKWEIFATCFFYKSVHTIGLTQILLIFFFFGNII